MWLEAGARHCSAVGKAVAWTRTKQWEGRNRYHGMRALRNRGACGRGFYLIDLKRISELPTFLKEEEGRKLHGQNICLAV